MSSPERSTNLPRKMAGIAAARGDISFSYKALKDLKYNVHRNIKTINILPSLQGAVVWNGIIHLFVHPTQMPRSIP